MKGAASGCRSRDTPAVPSPPSLPSVCFKAFHNPVPTLQNQLLILVNSEPLTGQSPLNSNAPGTGRADWQCGHPPGAGEPGPSP